MGLFLCMTRRKSCLIPSAPYRSSSSIKLRIASRSLFWQSRKKNNLTEQLVNSLICSGKQYLHIKKE